MKNCAKPRDFSAIFVYCGLLKLRFQDFARSFFDIFLRNISAKLGSKLFLRRKNEHDDDNDDDDDDENDKS